MKPYGVDIIQFPDLADLQTMGAKSSDGSIKGKSGDYRGYQKTSRKARSRRYWKRKARRTGKIECSEVTQ